MSTFLRKASWLEIANAFYGPHGDRQCRENICGWADRYGVKSPPEPEVALESWTDKELAEVMEAMSKVEPRVTVDMVKGVNNATLPPRVDGLPIVLVKFGDRYGIIDGKHRANKWKQVPGNYAVYIIHA
jgi:hypothetical protein